MGRQTKASTRASRALLRAGRHIPCGRVVFIKLEKCGQLFSSPSTLLSAFRWSSSDFDERTERERAGGGREMYEREERVVGARAPAQAAGAGQERMTPPVCLPLLLLLLWSRRGATFRRVCVGVLAPVCVACVRNLLYGRTRNCRACT